jgi:hypothetical protein
MVVPLPPPTCARTRERGHFSVASGFPHPAAAAGGPHSAGSHVTRLLPVAREERKTPRSAASSAEGGRGAAQWISPPGDAMLT